MSVQQQDSGWWHGQRHPPTRSVGPRHPERLAAWLFALGAALLIGPLFLAEAFGEPEPESYGYYLQLSVFATWVFVLAPAGIVSLIAAVVVLIRHPPGG